MASKVKNSLPLNFTEIHSRVPRDLINSYKTCHSHLKVAQNGIQRQKFIVTENRAKVDFWPIWPWNDLDLDPQGHWSRSHKVKTINWSDMLKGVENWAKVDFWPIWPWNDLVGQGQGHWSRSQKVKTINWSDMLKGSKIGQKLIFDLFDLEMTL